MLIQFKMKKFLLGTVIFFMTVPFCFPQTTVPSKEGIYELPLLDEGHAFHLRTAPDSLSPDSTLRKPIEKKFRMRRSPWVAVGLSAVIPGAGQFYNQSYWKVPVILGLGGYFAYWFYDNNKKYHDYRDRYSATQTDTTPNGDLNLKTLREFYLDQRNDFIWYFTILYVVNLIDAYVDAHLFDFDVKEEKIERFGKIDKEYKLNVRLKL